MNNVINERKKKLPIIISAWLTILMGINLLFLYNLPAYKAMINLQRFAMHDVLNVLSDQFFIIQVGFLICLCALCFLKKWGFYGLLIVYAFAVWAALHAIGSPIAGNALFLPPAWILITYILLRVVKIENLSVWHLMNQKKAKRESGGRLIDSFHPMTRFILKTTMFVSIGIMFFVIFFPIPNIPIILEIKTHSP
ncbi:MAG: hypothetical protein COX72_08715 [Gammaproteobacteria bacterium CG_4_10_14_0_2_um_filter_38_22]|nr:MAG: hypothetical protein COX72_08715 [Gammaproteobacteria bacterium CG_4_10_14_0_2_um_filter_38_22]PJB10680.1 MAG: hypothetical protein CO120_03545 [Gammaproteobacteria bacterium CG_4_9_14_3_um_filter_38_9]